MQVEYRLADGCRMDTAHVVLHPLVRLKFARVHVCSHMCVRIRACMCLRACARMQISVALVAAACLSDDLRKGFLDGITGDSNPLEPSANHNGLAAAGWWVWAGSCRLVGVGCGLWAGGCRLQAAAWRLAAGG